MAVSYFPLSLVGGMETLRMTSVDDTSTQERELLLASLATLSSRDIRWEQAKELCLAQLMAVNIGYCWKEFGENEWVFVLFQLRKWLESVFGHMEELVEGIHDVVKNINVSTRTEVDLTIESIENEVNRSRDCPMDKAETTIFIFCLLFGLHNLDRVEMTSSLNSLKSVN